MHTGHLRVHYPLNHFNTKKKEYQTTQSTYIPTNKHITKDIFYNIIYRSYYGMIWKDLTKNPSDCMLCLIPHRYIHNIFFLNTKTQNKKKKTILGKKKNMVSNHFRRHNSAYYETCLNDYYMVYV